MGDKISLIPKGSQDHYTFHFGPVSKVVDIHRARRVKGEPDVHETFVRIPHDRLPGLLEGIGQEVLAAYRSSLRPLRVGWMVRHHIGAEPRFFPAEADFADITSVRKDRLHVDEEKLATRVGQLEFLDGLYDLPLGQCFSLISCKPRRRWKIFGFGIRLMGPDGQPKLFWCSNRDLGKRIQKLGPKFVAAALALHQQQPG